MVEGATAGATARLLIGELTYDHFLAECSQATAVDTAVMAAALARLAGDEALRHRMGEAGRRRARDLFAWPRIIGAYEQLWRGQDAERLARARTDAAPPRRGAAGPAAYPAPERTFAGYPTRRLEDPDRLVPAPGAGDALDPLLAMPLTHHAAVRRVSDPAILRAAIARAPCSVDDLDRFWCKAGVAHDIGRAILAWMLKYDLLRVEAVGRCTESGCGQ
jgi:hypothetical protein